MTQAEDDALKTLHKTVMALQTSVDALARKYQRVVVVLESLGLTVEGEDVDPLEACHVRNRQKLAAGQKARVE